MFNLRPFVCQFSSVLAKTKLVDQKFSVFTIILLACECVCVCVFTCKLQVLSLSTSVCISLAHCVWGIRDRDTVSIKT